MPFERTRNGFVITTDAQRFDVDAIHEFLSKEAYWSLGIPRAVLEKAIENSLCFGLLDGKKQIGFTRVVTDRATFAWVCDVYVLPSHRGLGLALWMMESVLEHPDMRGLRRILLATRDAHGLYRRAGFGDLPHPQWWMVIANPNAYANRAPDQ